MIKKRYVTNEELIQEIYKYRDTGVVSEELGCYLLKIAENFANKGSFYNYTYKEDMIMEAVYTCLRYLHNFDPIRFSKPNPFAYFTSVTKNAFLNFIRKQKDHSKIKDDCYQNFQILNEVDENDADLKGIDYTVLKNDNKKWYK